MTRPAPARSHRPASRRWVPAELACFLLTALVFALLLLFGQSLSGGPLTHVALLTLLVAGGVVALCAWSQPNRVWSCSGSYLITLFLFHFGLAALLATHGSLISVGGGLDFGWITSFDMNPVLVLAALGLVSAALGASTASVTATWFADAGERAAGDLRRGPPRKPTRSEPRRLARAAEREGRWPAAAGVGFLILVGSIVQFVVLILRAGGLSLLTGSYDSLITLVYTNGSLPYLDFGLSLGLVLLVGSGPSRLRKTGVILFGLFAVFALPLGMRGTILFPALAAAVIAARRRLVIPSVVALVGGVFLLGAIGTLREIRQVGLAQSQFSKLSVNPIDGLAEMGASIRPLAEVVDWRDQLGEPSAGGRTYTGQATRLIDGRLLGRPEPPSTTDDRLFNTVIMDRVGPIGGSPIAEAYYNFGTAGVVGVLFAIGLVCGWIDAGRPGGVTDAAAVVVLSPLLIGVRNDFTPLLFQVVTGSLVLGAIRLIGGPAELGDAPAAPATRATRAARAAVTARPEQATP